LPLLQYNERLLSSITANNHLDAKTIANDFANGNGPEVMPMWSSRRPTQEDEGAPTWGENYVIGRLGVNMGDLLQVFEDGLKDNPGSVKTELYGLLTLVTILHEYIHDGSKHTGFRRRVDRERFDSPDEGSEWEKDFFGRYMTFPTIERAMHYENERKTPQQRRDNTVEALLQQDATFGGLFGVIKLPPNHKPRKHKFAPGKGEY
jgi:hypothetical protein